MFLQILLFVQTALLLLPWLSAGKKYKTFLAGYVPDKRKRWIFPGPLLLLDRFNLPDLFSDTFSNIYVHMNGLHGGKLAHAESRLFTAKVLLGCICSIPFSTLLAILAGGDAAYLALGLAGVVLIPFLMLRELQKTATARKRSILLELPEMLGKMILLVNAGETVQKALMKCVDRESEHPLQKELHLLSNELQMNSSLTQAMDNFNKRCALQEVSILTTTILLNHRRGGDEFVFALKELSHMLWEKRKTVTRTLGEEASSKLVFPMVVIFMVVMVLVAAPAMLVMNP